MADNKNAIRNAYQDDDPLLTFLPTRTEMPTPEKAEAISESSNEDTNKNANWVEENKYNSPAQDGATIDISITERNKATQTHNKKNNLALRKSSRPETDMFDEDEFEVSESERKRRRKVIKKLFEDLDGENLRKHTKSKDIHVLIRPQLHQRLVVITSNNGLSINDYINQALEDVTRQDLSKILQDGTIDEVIDELIDF